MKVGQVIGSTDSAAGEAKDDPIHYPTCWRRVYHNLGIDPHAMVYDVSNRPTRSCPAVSCRSRSCTEAGHAMTEEQAFLSAIMANPNDHTTKLIYADWLDERKDPRRNPATQGSSRHSA